MSLQMKLVSDLLKSIFDTSLGLSRSFFGKRNWFGQKVTTIPHSDQLPVLKVFLPFAQTVNRPVCQCKWWYSICGVKKVLIKIKVRKKPLISIWYPKLFPIYQLNSNKIPGELSRENITVRMAGKNTVVMATCLIAPFAAEIKKYIKVNWFGISWVFT